MEKLTVHRLRPDDSMESLSARYRVPVCMIMRANGMDDVRALADAREISIPPRCYCNRCALGAAADGGTVCVVQPGDTLYGISRQHGVPMRMLIKANRLDDPEDIRPGDRLIVPRVQGTLLYVREGENLEGIARQHGTTAAHIRRQNRLDADEDIYPGMPLYVEPSGS